MHVCETARGGVGTYLNMLSGFDDDMLSSVFVVPDRHRQQLGTTADIRTFSAGARGLWSIFAMLRKVLQTRRQEQPDLIFLHSSLTLVLLPILRMIRIKIPVLYCPHGWAGCRYADGSLRQRIVRIAEGRLAGLADRVVNVSVGERELARDWRYRGHHIVIENAVPDRRASVSDRRFVAYGAGIDLLFVGRFDRQKGLDILLRAFAILRQTRSDIRLHLIGEAVVADSAAVPEDIEGVFAHGWVDLAEIDDWYGSADAVVVPSRWEGLPLVVPEALRNGTPVIVSDRSCMPALIREGVTGYSFWLDPQALADCLAGFYIMNEVAQVYFNRYNELLGRLQGIVTQIPVSASA